VRYVLLLWLQLYRLPFSATKLGWAGLSRAGNIAVVNHGHSQSATRSLIRGHLQFTFYASTHVQTLFITHTRPHFPVDYRYLQKRQS